MQVVILKGGDEFLISKWMLKQIGCSPLEDFLRCAKLKKKLQGNATSKAMAKMGLRKY
jgi:hypothetical protein